MSRLPQDREYEAKKLIYRGAFSKIFIGRKKNSTEIPNVVIKMSSDRQSIASEIDAFKKLEGEKHILKLLDVCEGPTGDSIVFERCLSSLYSVLKTECVLFNDERKCIAQQFLLGLAAIHDKELVHRDIKPQNVLVTFDGLVKIGDLESMCENNKIPNNRIRTTGYSPLEVLIGDKNAQQSVDLWAAGCVLFHIFSGKELFAPEPVKKVEMLKVTSLFGCAEGEYFESLPNYFDYYVWACPFKSKFQDHLDMMILLEGEKQLTDSLLQVDPKRRTPARELLTNKYFKTSPLPLERISEVVERYLEKTHIERPEPFQGWNADSVAGEAQLPEQKKEEEKFDEACGGYLQKYTAEAPGTQKKDEEDGKKDKEDGSHGGDHLHSASSQESNVYDLSEWLENLQFEFKD